jgi:hypothetical protein
LKSEDINENYYKVVTKLAQLKSEISNLDEETLVEEVMYTSGPSPQDVDSILAKYIKSAKLSTSDRQKLEWFYIVSYI